MFLYPAPVCAFAVSVCDRWTRIISHKVSSVSACTAQEVAFGDLRWCSGLSWIAVLLGVFHNGAWTVAVWCITPKGESALCTNLSAPSRRKAERVRPLRLWPPIIFKIYFKLMVCVCVCEGAFCFSFHDGNLSPEWWYAGLCGFADVVFIVNIEEMFSL